MNIPKKRSLIDSLISLTEQDQLRIDEQARMEEHDRRWNNGEPAPFAQMNNGFENNDYELRMLELRNKRCELDEKLSRIRAMEDITELERVNMYEHVDISPNQFPHMNKRSINRNKKGPSQQQGLPPTPFIHNPWQIPCNPTLPTLLQRPVKKPRLAPAYLRNPNVWSQNHSVPQVLQPTPTNSKPLKPWLPDQIQINNEKLELHKAAYAFINEINSLVFYTVASDDCEHMKKMTKFFGGQKNALISRKTQLIAALERDCGSCKSFDQFCAKMRSKAIRELNERANLPLESDNLPSTEKAVE